MDNINPSIGGGGLDPNATQVSDNPTPFTEFPEGSPLQFPGAALLGSDGKEKSVVALRSPLSSERLEAGDTDPAMLELVKSIDDQAAQIMSQMPQTPEVFNKPSSAESRASEKLEMKKEKSNHGQVRRDGVMFTPAGALSGQEIRV